MSSTKAQEVAGGAAKSKQAAPRVSIITVVYNPGRLLEQTVLSVLALRYPALEYIIIDGASTDETSTVLARYQGRVSLIVSEPDHGIYDAMNKGIQLATGDYLWFLNAGDTPANPDVLMPLMDAVPAPDFLFGDTQLVREDGKLMSIAKAPAQLDWRQVTRGMVVSHQSFLPRRNLVQLYDRQYAYIADQKWIIDTLRRTDNGLRLDGPVSNYLLGGLSHRRFNRFVLEKIRFSFAELPLAQALTITVRELYSVLRFHAAATVRTVFGWR